MPISYDFFPLLIRKLALSILNLSSVGPGEWERELTNLTIRGPVLTPQVPLRIYNQPLSPSKALLEQRIPRGKRDAIVAAFDDEVDGAEHRFHFREAGCMMPEEVGSREGELGGEGGTWEEGRHG
jgi:hypothetical protein